MKQFFKKIVNFFINKIKEFKRKKSEESKIKDIRKHFEESFGISPERVVRIINTCELPQDEDKQLLISDLQKNADLFNRYKAHLPPCFFSPEIVDIHNESLENKPELPLDKLIKLETNASQEYLDK